MSEVEPIAETDGPAGDQTATKQDRLHKVAARREHYSARADLRRCGSSRQRRKDE
jgi:hypothetical protein